MNLTNRDTGSLTNHTQKIAESLAKRSRDFPAIFATGSSISLESLDSGQRAQLVDVENAVTTALESLRSEVFCDADLKFTSAQKDAANQAALLAPNWRGFREMTLREGLPAGSDSTNTVTLEAYGVRDVVNTRSYAREAYNEQDNKSAVAFSITYNLQSSRQDQFGETLFPTITIPADQAGVTITSNILYVMDNVDRTVDGDVYNLKRKNILRAMADPTVLRKDQTRALPVYRTASQDKFVPVASVPATTMNLDGTSVQTAALAFGAKLDLLGISQSDALIASGIQNQTDTLDPSVELENIYVSFTSGANVDIVKIPVKNLPFFNFVPAVQGDYKALTLNADSDSVLFNDTTKKLSGGALVSDLADIVTGHYSVRVRVSLSGQARTDTGNIVVYLNSIEVVSIRNQAGADIALNDAAVADFVTAINSGEGLGYDVLAYRSNANRRQQGQFVDVTKVHQRYMVPFRSPITARHPAHTEGQVDASDVQALVTATRIRLSNESVTAFLGSVDALAAYMDVRDDVGEGPEVLGVGRHFVRPVYITRDFDATTMVDSLKSHERQADIQAALLNELRDIAYTLHRDSEYQAASAQFNGGVPLVPTVVLATDPYTARYLMAPGDLRTLNTEFNVEVVTTLDVRMRGKIGIAFVVMDGDRNSTINPLNNGNLLWAPELVLTANISRQGQLSRETMVQPRYRFIQNLPVLGLLTVSNIPNVLGKVPLYIQDAP